MLTLYEKYLFEDLANDFIAQVKNAIRTKKVTRKSKAKGKFSSEVNATGRLAESLRMEIDDNGVSIFCLAYIDHLVYGAPPQRIEASVFEIENWLIAKGLEFNAINVMGNLQRFGSTIFQEHQGADSGLLTDVSFESKLQQVKEKLTLKMVEEISSQITEQFNYAA